MIPSSISVVIPTYGRERVLVETVESLLAIAEPTPGFRELILVDQTGCHESETERRLSDWRDTGRIRWLRGDEPHLTRAMNRGLVAADSDVVLFTDDDIVPGQDLLGRHLQAYRLQPRAWAVVGQVLQPGEEPADLPYSPRGGTLRRYLDFPFRRTGGAFVENAMAGNLSVIRGRALGLGGFDENFTPPVASRFETEFAKRLVAAGGTVWFEPSASIRHLRAQTGGTRSRGSHLTSIEPCHGVGDYYYALRRGSGWELWWYVVRRPFREVRTRFHLAHPWWIPVKLIGEMRALAMAFALCKRNPKLLPPHHFAGVSPV